MTNINTDILEEQIILNTCGFFDLEIQLDLNPALFVALKRLSDGAVLTKAVSDTLYRYLKIHLVKQARTRMLAILPRRFTGKNELVRRTGNLYYGFATTISRKSPLETSLTLKNLAINEDTGTQYSIPLELGWRQWGWGKFNPPFYYIWDSLQETTPIMLKNIMRAVRKTINNEMAHIMLEKAKK